MKRPVVDREKKAVVVSKEYYKKANVVGTEEYYELIEIQKNFRNFRIIVQTTKKNSTFKHLGLKFMEEYIRNHDDEENSIMRNFKILRGEEFADGKLGAVSFFELKEWFLNTFPEIIDRVEDANKRSSQLLEDAKKNAANHRKNRTCA